MKKTSKLFGAVALSAALALGTVAPAFADDTKDVDLKDGSAASTYINLKTEVDQLNVTIPLHTTIVAKTSGTIVPPTNYKITNKSATNVKVSKIEVTANKTDWTLSQTANAGQDPVGSALGTFFLTMSPTVDGASIGADAVLHDYSDAAASKKTDPSWNAIPAATVSGSNVTGKDLVLDFSKSTGSKLKKVIETGTNGENSTIVDVFTVKYTISPEGVAPSASHASPDADNNGTHNTTVTTS